MFSVDIHGLESSGEMMRRRPKMARRSWVELMKEKWPQYILQFSEMTTLHGVRYLGERSRSTLERVFWAMAMVVTYSCCWYFVAQVSSDWQTSPVVMSVETHATTSWSVPSPAVTVCTSSHISHSKIDFSSLWMLKNLSADMVARLDVVRELCGDVDGVTDYLDNDAIKYVLQNYLPDVRRVFVNVNRMQEDVEPLTDHIQTIMTPSSICFVHNMLPLNSLLSKEFLSVYEHYGLFGKEAATRFQSSWTPDLGYQSDQPKVTPMRLWGNGLRTSTKYLLSVSDLDYDPVCSYGSKALSVYLHNPAEIPFRVHSNVFLRTNYRVTVFITPTVTSTDDVVKVWNPTKRGCYFENERYLRYFLIYTQRNCERECDSNNTYTNCGCVLLSHPRNLSMPVCGPQKYACVERSQQEMILQEMKKNGDTMQCKCLPSCNEIDFVAETHWRPWQFNGNSTYSTLPANIDLNTTALSLLGIAVKKKYLNKTKRTPLMGSAAYVASIGGILSLFLGISFLSLFEVVYFMTLRVLTNIWNMRKREQEEEKQEELFWASRVDYTYKSPPFNL